MTNALSQSAQYVKGVGPGKIRLLNNLGIETVLDLLYHFPRRYEDRSNIIPISQARIGSLETVRGKVLTLGLRRIKGNRSIFQIAVGDHSGVIYGTWFNQPYMKKLFSVGDEIILYGKVEKYGKLQINAPEYEIIKPDEEDETVHTGRIVPIYPLTQRISQRYLRGVIKRCVDTYTPELSEFLPADILAEHKLQGLKEAVNGIHFPERPEALQPARQRLIYDEFFLLQLALGLKRKDARESRPGIAFSVQGELRKKFQASLPFPLTADQQQVVREIEADMSQVQPMNRLLQGDVGSGKTVVCMEALCICVQNGFQAALMAPTEILAQQHFRTLTAFLSGLGLRMVCLTSSMKKKDREESLQAISALQVDIVVGTHALIQEEVTFKRLGLVIIDEQHKFGVMQRARLQHKGSMPDVLVMSATPIPRTLAITLYGDLDISTIRQLPPGRMPIKTYWISEKKRPDLYAFLKTQLRKGNQIYVVYPLVKESTAIDLKAATQMFEHFRDEIFPQQRVGLIHGRMKEQEKQAVMAGFKAGGIDILVATTVIEVGIDVPNASIILIEHAERFGLSQLHQLRGRVGRGSKQAHCVLLSAGESEEAKKRLQAMVKTTDGFKIAEYDLLIRGPGEFFGTRQHGLPELKLGNIITDMELLKLARRNAFSFLDERAMEQHPLLRDELRRRFPGNKDLVMAR